MTTVLIVDDESGVRDLLSDALRFAGYDTEVASHGREALEFWRLKRIDLCVVDINMPTMDGFEFLEIVRKSDLTTPVLLLSARDASEDIARGLRYGADDYVRKPFSVEELLLRVGAILRRTQGAEDDVITYSCGPLTMDIDRHEVTFAGEAIELSATEFRLLEMLISRLGRLVTREQLLRDIWGMDFETETTVVDTYISYLRRKVHRDNFTPITTVRGVGFKMIEPTTTT
ncbi:MAG: response regulator transcription factor [Acidobacteriota bacterium]|nr:response regulator transcription factor [Acidobacteriota bacterium]MDE3031821.1 response regulator transcription factor [Acidobacteriota bacterium]MDE3093247.1 response regulator transcription factor [Acidobacteriota bacterium]MDE3146626.1 response regulator transcription factor [Acidobacteriota bacterium]